MVTDPCFQGASGHGGQHGANLPNHELHLAFLGCLDENGDQLGVPWAKNAMRADGCGQRNSSRDHRHPGLPAREQGSLWVADTEEFYTISLCPFLYPNTHI